MGPRPQVQGGDRPLRGIPAMLLTCALEDGGGLALALLTRALADGLAGTDPHLQEPVITQSRELSSFTSCDVAKACPDRLWHSAGFRGHALPRSQGNENSCNGLPPLRRLSCEVLRLPWRMITYGEA